MTARLQRMRVELPAVLALGSNLGDREQTLRDAVRAIGAIDGVTLVSASGIVETPAVKPDGVDQDAPAYLNAILLVRSALHPRQLLAALGEVEAAHGRVRAERWGDRTLDIDIVSLGGYRVDEPELTVPHPRARERAFVLAPWLDVQPDARIGEERVDALLAAIGGAPARYDAAPLLPTGGPREVNS
jgi:2-amino-4-hydroxy-6-hydroxymethyldihydropteridine diphosphokinase